MSQTNPIPKNVIYDTGIERSTGKKRTDEVTGGLSVSERARLFGTQIKPGSGIKASKPEATTKTIKPSIQQKIPWPPPERPSNRSDIVSDETDNESSRTDIDPRPKSDTFYSTSHGISHNQRLHSQINDNLKRKPLPSDDSREYTAMNRLHSHRHQKHPSSSSHQRSIPTHKSSNRSHYSRRAPSEQYTTDEEYYYDAYERRELNPPRNSSYYASSSNYFQPIRDPLEALYPYSSEQYTYQPGPLPLETDSLGLIPFDLGNLINSIQHDYISNVRPYVSSVEYVENNQNLANINILTSGTYRQNYQLRTDNRYALQHHYDVINPNSYYRREKPRPKESHHSNKYSSMKRRRHRPHYHDTASSPIHVFEAPNRRNQPEVPQKPPTPVPKVPTPVPSPSPSEDETTVATVPAEASKATTEDTTAESSSEDEAPAPVPVVTPALQRPPIVQPPPKQDESSSSESETDDSESEDSDSDSSTESEKDEKTLKPKAFVPATNLRTAPVTPQINNRPPASPKPSVEPLSSVKAVDPPETKKSSAIGGRFKSITNKFRRKKTS